jgi:hypothetical protein
MGPLARLTAREVRGKDQVAMMKNIITGMQYVEFS